MNKHLHLLLLLVCSPIVAFAQNSHPDRLPWVEGDLPPVKGGYDYRIARGEGSTLTQARSNAFNDILTDIGNKAGIDVNSRSIQEIRSSSGYENGASTYKEGETNVTTYTIDRKGFRAQITKVSEYYEYAGGTYRIWELYEVSQGEKFAAYIPE